MDRILEGFKNGATADHGMHSCPASKARLKNMCKKTLIGLSSKLSSAEEMALCDATLTSLCPSASSTNDKDDEEQLLKAIGTILYFSDSLIS